MERENEERRFDKKGKSEGGLTVREDKARSL